MGYFAPGLRLPTAPRRGPEDPLEAVRAESSHGAREGTNCLLRPSKRHETDTRLVAGSCSDSDCLCWGRTWIRCRYECSSRRGGNCVR